MSSPPADRILVGRVSGAFGVRGWVKVFSYTDPKDNILGYNPWHLVKASADQIHEVVEGRLNGKAIVARLAGCDDRDIAESLRGAAIEIDSSQLATLAADEYYWSQLIGLNVVDKDGKPLGKVAEMMETGANDVMVLDDRTLIPWVRGDVVKAVDLDLGRIEVNWDPDY